MEGTQLKELGCGCLVHFVINANYMSLFSMELEKLIVSVYKQQKWTLKNCQANKFPKTTIAVCFNRLQVRPLQHAKKVMLASPGLMDFAIGPVNSVFNLPDGQVIFFE